MKIRRLFYPLFLVLASLASQTAHTASKNAGKAVKKEYIRVTTPAPDKIIKVRVLNRPYAIKNKKIKLTYFELTTLIALVTSAFTYLMYRIWITH